jgi:hypothetical protein
METVVFILVLIVIVLAFAIFGDDLFEVFAKFFFYLLSIMAVGGILFLLYGILTLIFGK